VANQTHSAATTVNRMVIYSITNMNTGKSYIGQCRGDVRRRWSTHCSTKSGAGRSAIKCAILKYGRQSFEFDIIDYADSLSSLSKKEKFWINAYGSLAPGGYNLTTGGESPTMSATARANMSAARLARYDRIGRRKRPVTIKKVRCLVPKVEKQARTRRERMLGFKHTDEARAKIAASKCKPVTRSDGVDFPSIEHAAQAVGRNKVSLWRVLQGNLGRHTCGGYGWKYKEVSNF
jgi:group I intron endonuclease